MCMFIVYCEIECILNFYDFFYVLIIKLNIINKIKIILFKFFKEILVYNEVVFMMLW